MCLAVLDACNTQNLCGMGPKKIFVIPNFVVDRRLA